MDFWGIKKFLQKIFYIYKRGKLGGNKRKFFRNKKEIPRTFLMFFIGGVVGVGRLAFASRGY
jgi:hypothetical protein